MKRCVTARQAGSLATTARRCRGLVSSVAPWWGWFLVIGIIGCRPAPDERNSPGAAASKLGEPAGRGNEEQAREPLLSGVYFGASDDGRAWLVFLDVQSQWGSFFAPPRTVRLCEITETTTGGVTLQSGPAFRGVRYRFEGELSSDGMDGRFETTGDRPDRRPASAHVHLKRVADLFPTEAPDAVTGYYANVRFGPEGDLGGMELILMNVSDGPVGIVSLYEGVPGAPYALEGIESRGDKLRFGALIGGREHRFSGVLRGESVTLESASLSLPPQVLERRQSIEQFAKLVMSAGCP